MAKKRHEVLKRKPVSNRPKKLRQWSKESMAKALDAVASGKMGVNRAAIEFNVPCTSLKDRVAGRVPDGCNMGPKRYLTYEEESELVEFIIKCSKMGYGKTRQDVMKLVESCLAKKEDLKRKSNKLSNGWWVRFLQRWPQLSLRKGDSFAVVREEASTYDVFKNYFDLLEGVLTKHGLKNKPSQIYNCDESGMPLQHKVPKVLSVKGAKKVRQVSSGNKTQITILGCASATGQVVPPMVVFTGKHFNSQLSNGEVPGTLYGMSPNGWMDQELFSDWFFKHFLTHAVSERPLLLLLDGHSSHYTLDLVKAVAEKDVIIFCLPPHTTADSQPLDASCFGPLKTYWFETCRQYLFDNPGRVITKFQFSSLFAWAWSKGMTINNIVSGFCSAGIYPFAPNVILDKFQKPKDNSALSESISEGSSSTEKTNDKADGIGDSTSTEKTNDEADVASLKPETLKLYEKRLDNGYDVYTDLNYVTWLEKFHPDHLPPLGML